MSAGFLTAKVYQLLKSKPNELKPVLAQLASEIRLTLEWLGYEVEEKSAGSSTAGLRVSFKNDVELFHRYRPHEEDAHSPDVVAVHTQDEGVGQLVGRHGEEEGYQRLA